MSSFIANSISFSKDYSTFRVKGGDSNLIPRSNNWSNDIPIESLYYNVYGGMIKIIGSNEKNFVVNHVVSEYLYGNTEGMGYYNDYNKDPETNPNKCYFEDFNKAFLRNLISKLKASTTKKTHIIDFGFGKYMLKSRKNGCSTTRIRENAQKFTQYRSESIASNYTDGSSVEL